MSSCYPQPRRMKFLSRDADIVDGIVKASPSSTANKTVATSGSRAAERVNPVFGPGYASKFDNFSILPRIVREAVYSCVDWDTSRTLRLVMPETEQYYERRPYKMEMINMTFTPDHTYSPFTDLSAFVIDYRSGRDHTKMYHDIEIHTLGQQKFDYVPGYKSRFTDVMPLPKVKPVTTVRLQDKFYLLVHKWSYLTNYIYRNFHHVHAAVFCVHALSFFGSTPLSQKPLRHRPSELCVMFEDVDVNLVNRILRLPIGQSRRLSVDMDQHKKRVVSGTRDWLKYVQPTNRVVLVVKIPMTVPADIFNLDEVLSANEVRIHRGIGFSSAKIDITISQLRALNANSILFEFELPSVTVDELLLFVMDKIKAWLVDADPRRVHNFLFVATVPESKQLTFITEVSNLEMGARFKRHSVDGGVWIRGAFLRSEGSSILEDTKYGRHVLIRCGSRSVVSITPLYACKGYDDCQCVIGLGPCKPSTDG